MSTPWRAGSVLRISGLYGACLAAVLLVRPAQDRIDALRANTAPVEDLLYFGSPAMLEKISLGYRSLVADIYWMRTIQYFGRRDEADRRMVRYGNLAALLDITTTLDPDIVDAYRAGSSFLAEADPIGAGQPQEAIRLLDKGIASHPGDWRYRFDKGFINYWFLKDFKAAGDIWLTTSRIPGAPPWMESLAAMSLLYGGTLQNAKAIWEMQYRESRRPDVRQNALNHLMSIQASEDMWTLDFQIRKYVEKTGLLPWQLEDLVRAGFLKKLPVDPSGVPYVFNSQSAKVEVSPQSGIRYIEMPAIYREAFLKKLASQSRSAR